MTRPRTPTHPQPRAAFDTYPSKRRVEANEAEMKWREAMKGHGRKACAKWPKKCRRVE